MEVKLINIIFPFIFIFFPSGSMVLHREHSKELLKIWRNQLEKGIDDGDNDAYVVAYNQLQKEIDEGMKGKQPLLNADTPHILNSTSAKTSFSAVLESQKEKYKNLNPLYPVQIRRFEKNNSYERFRWFEWFANLSHTEIYCMNHISKARCNLYGRENIQKQLVDRFDLKTYDKKYLFCTHPVIQPFLYGWFPFSYLPTCPKMETLL
jgi:hypothetical protein